MKKILSRITVSTAAAVTVAAGLTGVVGATTYNYDGHGDDHHNKPVSSWAMSYDSTKLMNKTMVDISNKNSQTAESGEAEAEDNTTVGTVSTGAARNSNAFAGTIAIDNSSANAAALAGGGSGPMLTVASTDRHSTPVMTHVSDVSKTYVENLTDLNICNTNTQTATSGDAEAEDNTTVGTVSTGEATNTNTTSLVFTVTN